MATRWAAARQGWRVWNASRVSCQRDNAGADAAGAVAEEGRVPRRGVADHGLPTPLRSRPVHAAAGRLAIAAGPGPVSPDSASGEGNSDCDLGNPPP